MCVLDCTAPLSPCKGRLTSFCYDDDDDDDCVRTRVQKVRQARIQMVKIASRNAFLANKRKFEARLQQLQNEQRHDDDASSYSGEDVFQLQHHHLLACLEHTTVVYVLLVSYRKGVLYV